MVKKIIPEISIAPTRENEREITISFKFHAPSIKLENIEKVTNDILASSKRGIIEALTSAVDQEQKFLDATRR